MKRGGKRSELSLFKVEEEEEERRGGYPRCLRQMREVGVVEEGGGREGKLGGHIKTARGHRCWII